MGKLLNMVFLGLSNWIFSATSGIYSLFYGLATTRLFRADTIQDLSNRIYILVSVVILFAFSVKLIEAIVNPDLLTDAKKGVTGVLKRTIIGLLLIVAVPAIFNFVYYLQAEIIVGGVIEKLMLGYVDSDSESGVEGAGGELTSTIITSFIIPIDANGVALTESGLCGGDTNCNYAQKLLDTNADYEPYVTFLGGDPKYENLNSINVDKVWEKKKPIYQINGLALVAVGCFVLYQIIILCMDAGLRLVKLGMLEILAPVVIVSYIAAGSDHLSKWAKMTVQEFTSILIRIAGLCFMVLGFKLMNDPNSIFNNDSVSFWFKVFLIIGLLRMVKEIPDLFGKLFGANIKMGGIKDKLGEMAGIGKMAQNAWAGMGGLAKAGAMGAGALAAGIGKFGAKKFDDKVLKGKGTDLVRKVGNTPVVRGVKKGAEYVGKAGNVAKDIYKDGGKNTRKTTLDSLKKNFSAEADSIESARKKEAKLRRHQEIERASGGSFKVDKAKGKLDVKASVSGNGGIIQSGKNVHNELGNTINNARGMSSTERKNIGRYNDAASKNQEAQRKMDVYNDLDKRLKNMKESTDNDDQRGIIDRTLNDLQTGNLDINSLQSRLSAIGALSGVDENGNFTGKSAEGAISREAFMQMSEAVKASADTAKNENIVKANATDNITGNDFNTLSKTATDTKTDVDDALKDIEKRKEKVDDSTKAYIDDFLSTIKTSYEEQTDYQRKQDSGKINSAVAYANAEIQANERSAEATARNAGSNDSTSNSGSGASGNNGSAGPAPAPAPAPASSGGGSTTIAGGTVKADIDTSKLEQKLDEINSSVQTGSKKVADQVRNSGQTINSSLRTTNETLGKMNTEIGNINDTLSDIKKTTKDTNDKMDQDE